MPVPATTFVRSFATLTADANADITDGETVVIGGTTYTWEGTPAADGDLKFVTAFAPNMAALVLAINLTGEGDSSEGDYHTDMTKDPLCHAVLESAGVVTIYARVAGVVGDLIPITVGSSAVVLTDDSGGLLDTGAGSIDDAINNLQATAQLNSDVLAFLHMMEIDPDL